MLRLNLFVGSSVACWMLCGLPGGVAVAADEVLATVSSRGLPSYYNGTDLRTVWSLRPGDVVTTGANATVNARYLDSSTANVLAQSRAIFQSGWIDLTSGGVAVDLVAGTKSLTQVETPLGLVALTATTGQIEMRPSKQDAAEKLRELRLAVTAMQAEWQVPRPEGVALPVVSAYADAGDTVLITPGSSSTAFSVTAETGEVVVRLGDAATITLPRTARCDLAYDMKRQVFAVTCSQLKLTIEQRAETTALAVKERGEVSVPANSGTGRALVSRRASAVPSPPQADATSDNGAAPTPVTPPAPPRPTIPRLPQSHAYQRTLRAYLASLTEADVAPDLAMPVASPPSDNPEELYRTWLLTLDSAPQVGRKRAMPAVRAPGKLFLLDQIEKADAVCRPAAWPEPLAWLTEWDYAGNPFRGSVTLKRRAFVTAAVLLMLLDHTQETAPELGASRFDGVAHHLVLHGYTFPRVRSVVPAEVQQAYLAGLRKIVERALKWGPDYESLGLELCGAVGLHFAAEALDDDRIRRAARDFARSTVTDPEYFHPAGYFVSYGSYDGAYNGQARYFANWLALLTKDAAIEAAVAKAYRLRAHLSLPEPDGQIFGPTHFNPLDSREAWRDQYEWRYRDAAGAMITDEAAHLTVLPTQEELLAGGSRRINELRSQLNENPGLLPTDELELSPWSYRPWPNSWSFPNVLNYAQDSYRAGSYARLAKLHADNSPLLKLPFVRGENFVRTFEKAFTVVRQPNYGAILHTGPVGAARPGSRRHPGPYGFGGGQLSAFWTPATGSIILGRRGGMTFDVNHDPIDHWRQWPIHAVSGTRHDGTVFSSGLLREPAVEERMDGLTGTVRVSGPIPQQMFDGSKVLEGRVAYERTFDIGGESGRERLGIRTSVRADGQDKFAELVETIPIFLRDLQSQRKMPGTKIEFEIDGKLQAASSDYRSHVTAIRLSRFSGQVLIRFDRPRRAKLASQPWMDTYLSRAQCHNVLIDLLENNDQPVVFHEASVSYEITAATEH